MCAVLEISWVRKSKRSLVCFWAYLNVFSLREIPHKNSLLFSHTKDSEGSKSYSLQREMQQVLA